MAFNAYLKIDSLVDNSTAAGHTGEIEVLSFSWGASNAGGGAGSGTGGGAGKASLSDFNIMKRADQASAALFLACLTGSHYKTATFSLVKAGGNGPKGGPGTPFIEYDFTDVVVESIQWSGAQGGDDAPSESVSLRFGKVIYKSSVQNPNGGAAATSQVGWNVVANKQA